MAATITQPTQNRPTERPPLRDFRQEVTDNIVQMLERGVAPWQKPWEPGASSLGVPFNPTSERAYRGGNAIHLMATGLQRGYPRSFAAESIRSSIAAVSRMVRLGIFVPLLNKGMAEAPRDTLIQKKAMSERNKSNCPTSGGRIPELADSLTANASRSYKQETTTASAFMFHYAFLVVWGGVFPSAEYNNLLHFVHKLLHRALTAPKSCTLFTNCLQTVAHRKKLKIQCPGMPSAFPYK